MEYDGIWTKLTLAKYESHLVLFQITTNLHVIIAYLKLNYKLQIKTAI